MEKLNNRYVKLGAIGLVAFIITRVIIALINSYFEPNLPIANVLALIGAGVLVWFASKYIQY